MKVNPRKQVCYQRRKSYNNAQNVREFTSGVTAITRAKSETTVFWFNYVGVLTGVARKRPEECIVLTGHREKELPA